MPTTKRQRAYQLGAVDAYAGRPMRDMEDGGDAWLMDELGETAPTTGRNATRRALLCNLYEDGWHDARKAIGPACWLHPTATSVPHELENDARGCAGYDAPPRPGHEAIGGPVCTDPDCVDPVSAHISHGDH